MTPYRRFLALGAIIGALSACNQPAPVISAPPPEWTQPVPEPEVPILSDDKDEADAQTADYITRLWDAFQAAQNKLKRLDDWREGLPD